MSDIKRVTELAELVVVKRDEVAKLESQLVAAKSELLRLEQDDLPDLMLELGLSKFSMANGAAVEIQQDVQCGISEERRRAAHDWLVKNGFGGLIKTAVSVEFGVGELDAANRVAEEIGGLVKEAVHPSTLKSFVKEQLAAGKPLPFELFGVHPFNKVKITLKK